MTTSNRIVDAQGTIVEADSTLTIEQAQLLKQRSAQFARFVADSAAIAEELVRDSIVGDPAPADLERFIKPLSDMLATPIFQEADRSQVTIRVMYFLAELLIRKRGARWELDTVPQSPRFGQFLLNVQRGDSEFVMLSPYAIARQFADSPAPRSLANEVATLFKQLAS
jgi:hypothetical protein